MEDVWILVKMGIFQPAMLVYQRVHVTGTCHESVEVKPGCANCDEHWMTNFPILNDEQMRNKLGVEYQPGMRDIP